MRLEQIINYVYSFKPEVVLEVGTWNGSMAKLLLKNGAKKYIGFDVFETGTDELDEIENNSKKRVTEESVQKALNGYDIELIKGNTRETLREYVKDKKPFVDMAFIDGGHSKATIKSDMLNVFKIVKDSGCVFLDDYYFGCALPNVGAQWVMAELNVPYTVLPKVDKARDNSLIKVVQIHMKDVPRPGSWNMKEDQSWSYAP